MVIELSDIGVDRIEVGYTLCKYTTHGSAYYLWVERVDSGADNGEIVVTKAWCAKWFPGCQRRQDLLAPHGGFWG